ncbi:classical arabinogalactan protein 6-like [Gossypium hirsutum]|uniref:Classical arabinogalactan protein 6-like n=1 Tax=Gossypium hirsutum TaxID=3635 RepID=A0ABM2ZXF3_GOSHI|nr:classical arabinogalactan protein 6-like [Gossypium hirsutum]
MACQHFLVVALVFIAFVGALAADSSHSSALSKSPSSSPSKSPSSASPTSSPKSSSTKSPSPSSSGPSLSPSKSSGGAPKSSASGSPKSSSSSLSPSSRKKGSSKANKGSPFEVESAEEVSSPPLPPTADYEVSDSPSPSSKYKATIVDSVIPLSSSNSLARSPSNAITIKAITSIIVVAACRFNPLLGFTCISSLRALRWWFQG